ncbi:uncharacterized membrane protein YebE (DUF533 family) [Rhodovulum iodosum]|uniref:Uncharacterized membrane protein YebE (DUF533 family) n=1 Tax=Rhodovulum iodosum TaxID=68291 RepID=A0ABV3XPR2_9RHOB|nr:tellurite resistance TerB family protein [Rhodovulum robiginosum]RSK31407.1 tellurite resistance TerB family protein [Rhodovulum robiginosum]
MSFVKTMATLAAGFAAAKGVEHYRKIGGMAGLQEKLKSNEQVSEMTAQLAGMMEKMGLPGGAKGVQDMFSRMGEPTARAGESATAGLAGLMAALGGAAAAGTSQAGEMANALTGHKMTTETMEENAKLMIRAMIQAAKADGEIDAEERARIFEHLGDVSEQERAFVEDQIAAPVDPAALAADTSDAMRAQVYATAAMAVRVDNAAEAAYLDNLAAALGLSDETVSHIHAAMGASV